MPISILEHKPEVAVWGDSITVFFYDPDAKAVIAQMGHDCPGCVHSPLHKAKPQTLRIHTIDARHTFAAFSSWG